MWGRGRNSIHTKLRKTQPRVGSQQRGEVADLANVQVQSASDIVEMGPCIPYGQKSKKAAHGRCVDCQGLGQGAAIGRLGPVAEFSAEIAVERRSHDRLGAMLHKYQATSA